MKEYLDIGAEMGPDVTVQPLSGRSVRGKGVALLVADLGSDIKKVQVRLVVRSLEGVVTMRTDTDNHDIVGQNPADHTEGLDENKPRAEEGSYKEHAEGASLWYAAAAFVWFAKASRQGVDKLHVLEEIAIGIEQSRGDTHGTKDGIQQGTTDLVEAFPDVGRST